MNLQYSQRHSMINHCDYISFGQFNLFTYTDMPLGDSKYNVTL